METYLLAHGLTIAAVLASLLMLSRLSGSGRTPQSTLAWLLAFAFMPVVPTFPTMPCSTPSCSRCGGG